MYVSRKGTVTHILLTFHFYMTGANHFMQIHICAKAEVSPYEINMPNSELLVCQIKIPFLKTQLKPCLSKGV